VLNSKLNIAVELCFTDPEKAYEIANEQLQHCVLKKNELSIYEAKMVLAHASQFMGMYSFSYQLAQECLNYFNKTNENYHIGFVLNTLGFIFNYFDDHARRLDVNLKSLEIRKKLNDIDGYSRSLNNTGDTYIKLGKYLQAIDFLKECLDAMPKENLRLLCVARCNLGEAYYAQKEFALAQEFFNKSIESSEQIEFYPIIFNCYVHLSMIKLQLGNNSEARKNLDLATKFLNKYDSTLEEKAILNRIWGNYYEKIDDYKNAVSYFKAFYFAEEKLKTIKQEKEIKSIQFANEINELKSQNTSLEQKVFERTSELETTLKDLTIQEEFSRKILNSTQQAILVFDINGKILDLNPSAQKLLKSEKQLSLTNLLSFTDETSFNQVLNHLFLPDSEENLKFQFDMTAQIENKILFLEVSFTKIEDANTQKGIVFINDVTYRVQAERERKNDLETEISINLFAQSLFKSNNESEILWGLAKDCISRLAFEDCVIYMIDKNTNELVQKAAYGPKNPIDFDIHNPITIPIGNGIVGSVAKTGIAEIIYDTSLDERYILDDDIRLSEIAVPIKLNDEVIGVIDSEHPEKNFYSERHLRILTTISKLVANRIDKLREQEEKEKLQEEILRINTTLEEQVKQKTKENIELNLEIQDKEKSLMLSEMASLLAHEMNTPLANIKNASLALKDKQGHEIQTLINQIDPALKIINEIIAILDQPLELISSKELRIRTQKVSQIIEKKNLNSLKNSITLLARLNIQNEDFLIRLNQISCIEDCLTKLFNTHQANAFVTIINDGTNKVIEVVQEVQSLQIKNTIEQKSTISLIETVKKAFDQFGQEISIRSAESDKNITSIQGISGKLLQLWNGIHRIVLDHSTRNENTKIQVVVIDEKSIKTIELYYENLNFDKTIFNKNVDFNSYTYFDHAMKVRLSFIKTILEEHDAIIRVNTQDDTLIFRIEFK
jgi:PAS domain S-box-containing protein